jgi:hypothetical protein
MGNYLKKLSDSSQKKYPDKKDVETSQNMMRDGLKTNGVEETYPDVENDKVLRIQRTLNEKDFADDVSLDVNLNFNENETFAGFEESSAKERKQRRNFSKITNEYLEVR